MVIKATIVALAGLSLFSNVVLAAQQCEGQSCYIAYLSGSTKTVYPLPGGPKAKAAGASKSGETCIKKWLTDLGAPIPQMRRMTSEDLREAVYDQISAPTAEISPAAIPIDSHLEKRQSCKPTMLLYARGTLEMGEFGISIGPMVSRAASKLGWGARGITSSDGYGASISDDFCVGLPGGKACVDVLKKLSAQCPTSNFVLSGYSQGAMVARICAAYQTPDVQQRIKALVLWGDPMNGADVKGIPEDKIKTVCRSDDGVCKGEFNIGFGHLAYSGDGKSVSGGMDFAKAMVARG